MSSIRRVAIIGAGLAGLACAVAVTRAGVAADVFASRSIEDVEVLHLDAVPNLVRALDHLGVLAECQGLGFAYSRTRTTDAQGRVLEDMPLSRLTGEGKPAGLGLLQSDLLRVLSDRAVQQGARLHAGTHAVQVDPEKGIVQLLNGASSTADLVLLAAGLEAPLRRTVFAHAPGATQHRQQWWNVILPRARGLDQPTTVVGRVGQKLHVVPIAPTKAGLTFCSLAMPPLDAQSSLQTLRATLRSFSGWPEVWQTALLESAPLLLREVREALLPRPWHCGRVLAVGDCAHALVPHFGQGAAQALEDAVVLQELLLQDLSVPDLATRFTSRRITRLEQVHALTSRAALWDEHPAPSTNWRALSQALVDVVAAPA